MSGSSTPATWLFVPEKSVGGGEEPLSLAVVPNEAGIIGGPPPAREEPTGPSSLGRVPPPQVRDQLRLRGEPLERSFVREDEDDPCRDEGDHEDQSSRQRSPRRQRRPHPCSSSPSHVAPSS